MLTVDRYARIRQLHREGGSLRDIARQLRHSPKTILKALRQPEPPPYTLSAPRTAPTFGPVRAIVDAILAADEHAPRNQRHTAPQAAATAKRARLTVTGYGGGTRRVEAATGTGHWYKGGEGLVPVRGVFVKDTTGTHRDEYLLTTDLTLTADAVVGLYCGRWSIETTFQECRSCVGLETTRGRGRATVTRAAPCLFGLYTVAAVLFHSLPEGKRVGSVRWAGKATVTFSDALTAVRRWMWTDGVFPQAKADTAIAELPADVRELLLSALAPAP
jgi:hypothetical protein